MSLVFVTYSEANDLEESSSASDDTQVLGAEKETSKILNQADAIELLMTKERLNASEASRRLAVKENTLFSKTDYIMKTKQYYVGNDAHIGIGVLLEVHKAMGGRASITSIKNLWIDIVEGRNITFHENYCTDLTQSYPTARVRIKARG